MMRSICVFLLTVGLPLSVHGTNGLAMEQLADGIYVHQGVHEDVDSGNRGDIANIGFVIGDDCVAVIDTGGSPAVGEDLRAAVEQRTEKPICHVINTHVHPDHVFGNNAFVDSGAEFIGHHRLAAQLSARGEYYREAMARMLDTELDENVIVPPDRAVEDSMELDLGGRVLRLQAMPTAHTDTDLVVLDQATGTLWLGDLLFVDRIPSLDGSLLGWLAVMDDLRDIDAERVVPGHGPVSLDWPEAAADQQRYLEVLRDQTRQVIDAGATIDQALRHVGRDERDAWQLFEEYHEGNVQSAFAELEWE
ncbi:quinoprotein relay system zinc metallohydrolase 2 [Methylonatrum kenyense]|uniref:quinoprotein relay system zinc metallohydrolase 2 n=1 Tax=Methylonatrum kenyense TaxID=455253 RepID=UPI0020BEFAC5|nr:quinoprotein relay system zinc metallohydrolase 2 [Methylonatrum kenyense]MCK8516900.1 quinoprotein relay system zinc metallohydrolase 2 [Methylonatrum kenyense]